MKDENKVNLSAQASAYFKKRLMLIDTATTSVDRESEDGARECLSEEDIYSIPSADILGEDVPSKANEALGILSNFPVDKSVYAPIRTHIGNYSFFEKGEDINKLLNALLFSTKMAFFDTDSSTSEILSEVSRDSFGYINLLRTQQNDILNEQMTNANAQLDYFNSQKFLENIEMIRASQEYHSANDQEFLDFLIEFYAKNVMNSDIDLNKNIIMINNWLNE